MCGFDDHADAARVQHVLNGVGNLGGQPLLYLQTFAENIDETGELGNADDAAGRQISDMHFAQDGDDMMFAMRFEPDVAQDDDFVIGRGLLESGREQLNRIFVVTGKELLIGADDPLGCSSQPLPVRIVTGPFDQSADRGLRFRLAWRCVAVRL